MRITIGEELSVLKDVYVVDFGDNYHRTDDEPSTDLEKAARKIRRRYKYINDYTNALAVYQEYMAWMAYKHGGPELFKIKLKNDVINDFIPPKPRMKNTANNRMLLKNKILVSRINLNKINDEKLEDTLEAIEEFTPEGEIISDTKAKDHIARRIIKEGNFNQVRLRDVKEIRSIDFLEEYFNTKNKNISVEKEEKIQQISLSQIASGEYDDLVQDTTEEDEVIYYQGNYMNAQTVEDLKVFKELGHLGWNSVKIMKDKGVSKRVTKIVKSQNKKNKKKNKKGDKKRKKTDDFLVSVMMDNDYDNFASFEEDMLNFTADNIFN